MSRRVYDGTSVATPTFASNAISGDVVTPINYASATFADQNVGSRQTVTVTGITLGGPDGGNYLANSTATTTADITIRPVTVTANAQVKTVGQPDPPLTYQVTSGTVVGGDSFTVRLTRAAGEPSEHLPSPIPERTAVVGQQLRY